MSRTEYFKKVNTAKKINKRVREAHPDWSPKQVYAVTGKILAK